MKKRIFWFTALLSLIAAAAFGPALFGLTRDSFGGLTISIFLGYCAIIVVSQVFSCLAELHSLLKQWTEKRRESRRMSLS